MKLDKLPVRHFVLAVASLLMFWCANAIAQTPGAQTSAPQSARIPARVTQVVDDANRLALRGNVHPLARAEFDQGAVSDAQPMNRMLLLLQRSPEQEAALRQLLDQQQSKDSPNFHKWLTPEQFGQQFGPADSDIQTVTDWLTRQGFQNISMGPGHMVIEFSGTARQVRNAFGTEIHQFRVHGEMHMANTSDPQIPAALAPVVLGIRSLHNFAPKPHRRSAGVFQRTKATGEIKPLLTGPAGPNQIFAVGPADFAKIYNIAPSALTGDQQTIAVVGVSNIDPNDVSAFRNLFGLPVNPPKIILNGPDPGILTDGSESEADLDVEWSGAVAPKALIDFVLSEDTASTAGIDLSAVFIIENNLAGVLTESFGACEPALGAAGTAFYSDMWEQAAAQGITVVVSSGDGGSAGCDDFNTATVAVDGLAVSGIASTQFNVAVGGTDFDQVGRTAQFWNATNGAGLESAISYIPESTWNDSCANSSSLTACTPGTTATLNIVAASGGPSAFNKKPSWQNGVTPNDTFRDIPDVSLFASDGHNGSFYAVCEADAVQTPSQSCVTTGTFEFLGVGGTSASTPSFAGIMALINEKTGQRQGNASVVLYKLAAGNGASCNASTPPASTCVFNDVTKGTDSVPCAGGSPNCSSSTANTNGVLVDPAHTSIPAWTAGAAYDEATGLGSVNVANLATGWLAAVGAFRGTQTTLKVNGSVVPISGKHGLSVNFTVDVAALVGTGTPTGDIVLLGTTTGGASASIPAASLTSGTVTFSSAFLPGGAYSLAAHYAGDGTFSASDSAPVAVNIQPEASKTAAALVTFDVNGNGTCNASGVSVPYGTAYIFRVDINIPGTNPCTDVAAESVPTGKVTLKDNGNALDGSPQANGVFTLNSQGFFEDQPIQLNGGAHSIVAAYSGDLSYAPSTSAAYSVTITKAATQTTVVPSVSTTVSGGSVTITATIATQSNGAGPTGSATFSIGGVALTNGQVTVTPTAATATAPASATAKLTTTISAFAVPQSTDGKRPSSPTGRLLLLLAMIVLFWVAGRLPAPQRRAHVYASVLFLAVLALGIAACGGASSTPAVPQSKSATISVQYGGDINYTSSSGQTTVTVQ